MSVRRQHQVLCYTIEGLNSFATVIYTTYLYFLLHAKFGFGDMANLTVAAWLGVVYAIGAWQGGKFGQRYGNFAALKLGFGLMTVSYLLGVQFQNVPGQILSASLMYLGMCFTWPALEALVTEEETPDRVPHAVGLYNITWAWTNAVAVFAGGKIIAAFGYTSIYYLPLAIVLGQLALTFWLERSTFATAMGTGVPPVSPAGLSPVLHQQSQDSLEPDRRDSCLTAPSPDRAKKFRQLAWLANPFAYLAINTLIAVLPGVAAKFQLTTTLAGITLSLWCFARLLTFIALWRWPGWHYRFHWLLTAYLMLSAAFAVILIAPSIWLVLPAQALFGAAIGLIYYSSLFYAMDASDTRSEHGGIHEAAIGIGNCFGPAAGAAALWLAPQNPTIGAWAVTGLLAMGLVGLLRIKKRA